MLLDATDKVLVDLMENVDLECESFLLRTERKTSLERAGELMAPVVGQLARILEHVLPKDAVAMLEIQNRQMHSAPGEEIYARVGVGRSKELMLLMTPPFCEHHHIFVGPVAKAAPLSALESMGFTPRGMVGSAKLCAHAFLSRSMATMGGGDA